MKQLFLTVITFFTLTQVRSEGVLNIISDSGYQVNLTLGPISIVPEAGPCPFGYTYKVRVPYTITFTGVNIPAAGLTTLQGTVSCQANAIFFDLPNSSGSDTSLSSTEFTNLTDCASVTPTSLNCNIVVIQIEGPGIPNQFLPVTVQFLPIHLSEFKLSPRDGNAKLSWVAFTGSHFDHFLLERSKDLKLWETLNKIDYQETNFRYTHTDLAPHRVITYYRLKLVDLDGSFSYSNILSFRSNPATFAIFPNPVRYQLNIDQTKQGEEIILSDMMGRIVLRQRATEGRSIIGTQMLKDGIYVATYQGGATKFIKTTN